MKAILEISSPIIVKDVQKLMGRVAVLNKFVSKATDKCLPFFKTLKKASHGRITVKQHYRVLKPYLSNPPLLSLSKECEDLFLYLVVSATVVSTTLIQEKFKVQRSVYYINQVFLGA